MQITHETTDDSIDGMDLPQLRAEAKRLRAVLQADREGKLLESMTSEQVEHFARRGDEQCQRELERRKKSDDASLAVSLLNALNHRLTGMLDEANDAVTRGPVDSDHRARLARAKSLNDAVQMYNDVVAGKAIDLKCVHPAQDASKLGQLAALVEQKRLEADGALSRESDNSQACFLKGRYAALCDVLRWIKGSYGDWPDESVMRPVVADPDSRCRRPPGTTIATHTKLDIVAEQRAGRVVLRSKDGAKHYWNIGAGATPQECQDAIELVAAGMHFGAEAERNRVIAEQIVSQPIPSSLADDPRHAIYKRSVSTLVAVQALVQHELAGFGLMSPSYFDRGKCEAYQNVMAVLKDSASAKEGDLGRWLSDELRRRQARAEARNAPFVQGTGDGDVENSAEPSIGDLEPPPGSMMEISIETHGRKPRYFEGPTRSAMIRVIEAMRDEAAKANPDNRNDGVVRFKRIG